MAAKKNTTHARPPKTHKVRKRKLARTENRPTEASVPADLVLTEAAEPSATISLAAKAREMVADAKAESSRMDTPLPAKETTTADNFPEPAASANQLRALDAAAKVLEESGQSMSCKELIAAMAASGYWRSLKGRTPAGTLYSALLRELQTKGERARFRKIGRGQFGLRPTE